MSDRALTLRRIEKLKATMPTGQPRLDSVMFRTAEERQEIAMMYMGIGETNLAADWYLEGARWSQSCGDILGAVALLKRCLKIRRIDAVAGTLYRERSGFWQVWATRQTPSSDAAPLTRRAGTCSCRRSWCPQPRRS